MANQVSGKPSPVVRLQQVADPDRRMPGLDLVAELVVAAQSLIAQLDQLVNDLADLDVDRAASRDERREVKENARETAGETLAELRLFLGTLPGDA